MATNWVVGFILSVPIRGKTSFVGIHWFAKCFTMVVSDLTSMGRSGKNDTKFSYSLTGNTPRFGHEGEAFLFNRRSEMEFHDQPITFQQTYSCHNVVARHQEPSYYCNRLAPSPHLMAQVRRPKIWIDQNLVYLFHYLPPRNFHNKVAMGYGALSIQDGFYIGVKNEPLSPSSSLQYNWSRDMLQRLPGIK